MKTEEVEVDEEDEEESSILKDPLKNVLYIDLTRQNYEIKKRPLLFQKYLGGTGVGIQLLEEEVDPTIDPLSSKNVIILATGPLVGAFPMASKTVAMFKSPLTQNLGESHAGGRSSLAIRSAGLGAIVIRGKAQIPIYLVIDGHKVYFRDARTFWKGRSSRIPRYAIAKHEENSGFRTILVTGPAADNGVSFATVVSESYRHFGRLGLGAVFGSKNLKAIQIGGKYAIPVKDRKNYKSIKTQIMNRCTEPEFIAKYRELGTAGNVMPLNLLGAFPTRNLQDVRFEQAENLSGEHLQTEFLARRVACSNCPVACIHLAALRESYNQESFFYKTNLISYDYELIYALGSMIGIGNTNDLLILLNAVEELGLDAITAGVVLAWACEALEKQIITLDETIVPLRWGNRKEFQQALNYLITQPNEFYQTLAQGSVAAASKYGGKDILTTFGGLEMAGYHTGPTQVMGFLYGTRHSHLDSGPYSLDQKKAQMKKYPTSEEIVNYIINEESWRQILTSLVICLFARKVYDENSIIQALEQVNLPFTADRLKKLGKEIYGKKNRFKQACGVVFEDLIPSQRIFNTPSPLGSLSTEFFEQTREKMVSEIKKIMESLK